MSETHYILEIHSALGEVTTETIRKERAVIGRREGDVVIDDTGASGRHAELVLAEGALMVSDLGSTNGVVWQGAIVREPFRLELGETFQIGRTRFTLKALNVAPPDAPIEGSEEEDEEEKTAFMSAAELGMEDPPESTPEVSAPPSSASSNEAAHGADSAPQPSAPVADSPPPSSPLDEEEEEEATAWMDAMDDEAPESPSDWRDEAAPGNASDGGAQISLQTKDETPPPASAPEQTRREVVQIDERRPNFQGRGDELLKLFLVHGLLVVLTAGIYTPWFISKFLRYLASRTVFGPTESGWVYLRFHGDGGGLFVKFLVGYILSVITLGIYGAWFICDLARWFLERSEGVAEDGTVYRVRFEMQGGELLVTLLINYLLTVITMGIYGAWAYCKVRAKVVEKIAIYEDNDAVGGVQFVGTGGALLPLVLVQWLLCVVTLGIYIPWAYVRMTQFMQRHTRVYYRERWFQGDFTGQGAPYLVLNLVGVLLTQLTLGIYLAWYYAKKRAFETNNEVWYELR